MDPLTWFSCLIHCLPPSLPLSFLTSIFATWVQNYIKCPGYHYEILNLILKVNNNRIIWQIPDCPFLNPASILPSPSNTSTKSHHSFSFHSSVPLRSWESNTQKFFPGAAIILQWQAMGFASRRFQVLLLAFPDKAWKEKDLHLKPWRASASQSKQYWFILPNSLTSL